MNQNRKRDAEDDHYDRGRARKRRRISTSVLDPHLDLPIPEAGYHKRSNGFFDPNGFDANPVSEARNVTGDGGDTIGEESALSPRGHIKTGLLTGGHHCLIGFRIVVLRTCGVSRFWPLLPLKHEQARIERPPTETFAVDVPAVPSGPPASSSQERAASEPGQADSVAVLNDHNNHRHNAEPPRLDLGRVAFETEHRIDYSVQTASRLEPQSSALTIADQLPGFEPLGEVSGIELRAIPIFDEVYRVVEASWNIAFFLGVYLYVDNESYRGLEESLAPITRRICRQLTFREIFNMPHLIVYHADGIVKLDFYTQLPVGSDIPRKLPSIPTFTIKAFVQQLSIHLTEEQERSVMVYWNQIPPFNPNMPNVDPTRPDRPARPRPLDGGRYDWSNCLQPIRWFMCPCVLRHECKYTGVGAARCAAWRKVCTKHICQHGPETGIIHVGSICGYLWQGLACRDGTRCKFVHGIAVTVKSIEHQYCHHRTMLIVNKRQTG